jgi:hypothetical protein
MDGSIKEQAEQAGTEYMLMQSPKGAVLLRLLEIKGTEQKGK